MVSDKARRFLYIGLAILLFIYVGYHIYIYARDDVYTEDAVYATVADTIETTGVAIRSELVVESVYSGVLNYNIPDGSRVAKGGAVANIYANERDAMAQGQLAQVESEIQMLKAISNPGDSYISNPELIGDQINNALNNILLTVKKGDYTGISSCRDDFQLAINRRNTITGLENITDYSLRLSELEAQKTTLTESMGSLIGSIAAPEAGYFMSSIDGYENLVDINKAENLTVGEVRNILNMQIPEADEYCVGKICPDYTWYMVALLDSNEAAKLGDSTSLSIEVPFVTSEKIPVTIVSKNRDSQTGELAVILKCTYMNAQIASIRNETIRINVNEYEGVLVTEKAIRFEDVEEVSIDNDGNEIKTIHENVKGVFVKTGNTIEFVQVFSYKTINGYAICKTELSDDEEENLVTYHTIQLYDKVLVGGTDLYDGKLIE